MITSIPAAEPAISIASSGSPPLNPPIRASILACVPHSLNVTTRTCGNPAGAPRASTGPPKNARFAAVSGASSTNPSTAARRIPRQKEPARPSGASGPATRRNTDSSTRGPSRRRARVKLDLFGIASPIPSSAPTRFSATSS